MRFVIVALWVLAGLMALAAVVAMLPHGDQAQASFAPQAPTFVHVRGTLDCAAYKAVLQRLAGLKPGMPMEKVVEALGQPSMIAFTGPKGGAEYRRTHHWWRLEYRPDPSCVRHPPAAQPSTRDGSVYIAFHRKTDTMMGFYIVTGR